MPYAILTDTFADDPVLLQLPRGARLLWVEALTWCCRHLTDGAIPRHSLHRITDEPEPLAAVEALVAAGRWEETPTGWSMVGYLDEQWSRERVEQHRAGAAARKDRSRRHQAGDHTACTRGRYCPEGELEPVTRDGTRDERSPSRRASRPLLPSSPTLRSKGLKKDEGAVAPAPSGSPARPLRPRLVDGGTR